MFILADRQPHEQVWQAIMALGEQALVMFWPDCQPWLLEQLNHPSAEYVEHRAAAAVTHRHDPASHGLDLHWAAAGPTYPTMRRALAGCAWASAELGVTGVVPGPPPARRMPAFCPVRVSSHNGVLAHLLLGEPDLPALTKEEAPWTVSSMVC